MLDATIQGKLHVPGQGFGLIEREVIRLVLECQCASSAAVRGASVDQQTNTGLNDGAPVYSAEIEIAQAVILACHLSERMSSTFVEL